MSLTSFQSCKVSWRTLDFQEEQRYSEDNRNIEREDWGVHVCHWQVGLICRARQLGLIHHCAIRNPVIDVAEAKSYSSAVDWKRCDYDIHYYMLNQRESRDCTKVFRILVDLTWIFWFWGWWYRIITPSSWVRWDSGYSGFWGLSGIFRRMECGLSPCHTVTKRPWSGDPAIQILFF